MNRFSLGLYKTTVKDKKTPKEEVFYGPITEEEARSSSSSPIWAEDEKTSKEIMRQIVFESDEFTELIMKRETESKKGLFSHGSIFPHRPETQPRSTSSIIMRQLFSRGTSPAELFGVNGNGRFPLTPPLTLGESPENLAADLANPAAEDVVILARHEIEAEQEREQLETDEQLADKLQNSTVGDCDVEQNRIFRPRAVPSLEQTSAENNRLTFSSVANMLFSPQFLQLSGPLGIRRPVLSNSSAISSLVGRTEDTSAPRLLQFIRRYNDINDREHPKHNDTGGLSLAIVHALPMFSYSDRGQAPDAENRNCMVCLAKLEGGDTVCALPCLHIYHKFCIDQWFEQKTICPCCTFDVADWDIRGSNLLTNDEE